MIVGYWIRPARWISKAFLVLIIGLVVRHYFPGLTSEDRFGYERKINSLNRELINAKQARMAAEQRVERKRQARIAAEQARIAKEQQAERDRPTLDNLLKQ